MSMREAFDIFFENNNKSWRRAWGTLPRVPRCDKYRQSSLIVAENDKFDELEWLPKLQEKRIDFNSLEEDLEFRIHPQIKDFLSTYWFMPLEGKTDKIDHLVLHELLPQSQYELLKITKCYFNKKEYHYRNDGNYFLIGDFCCIDGNDSYMVHINNDTGEVFAVQNFDKISIKIANSIEELLGEMKGVWDM